MIPLLIAGQTDVGRQRRDNQDAFISSRLWGEHIALLVVIDGVGGYAGGDRAAAIAKDAMTQYMATPTGDTLTMLREAVIFANNRIDEARRQDPALAQMCCVMTAAVADALTRKVVFVHVGDTRLYRFRSGSPDPADRLRKLTHDHSLVGVREDANQLTEAEAMQHPRRNEVLRTVGSALHRVDDPDFLESGEADFRPGDTLLLCSDGLTDMLPREGLTDVLSRALPLEEQADELIRRANEQGGQDNITVVLARNKAVPEPDEIAAAAVSESLKPPHLPAQPAPTASVEPSPVSSRPKTGKGLGRGLLIAVLLGLGFLAWYAFFGTGTTPPGEESNPAGGIREPAVPPGENRQAVLLDSLLRLAYRRTDHRLIWPEDTLRLASPLVLSDSLRAVAGADSRRPVMVVAADTAANRPAIRIVGIKNAQLENLVIQGYRTAIETDTDGQVQLRNVYFGGGSTISATISGDTFRNTAIRISVQNLPAVPGNTQANANR